MGVWFICGLFVCAFHKDVQTATAVILITGLLQIGYLAQYRLALGVDLDAAGDLRALSFPQ